MAMDHLHALLTLRDGKTANILISFGRIHESRQFKGLFDPVVT